MSGTSTPPMIFDRNLIINRMTKAANNGPNFVMDLVITDLAERLAVITRDFKKALIIGPVVDWLPQTAKSANGIIHFDRRGTLVDAPEQNLDPENLALPAKDYDLIVSLLDLQTVNDVPGFLTRLRQHLGDDGLAIIATIGGTTLAELREAWLMADAEASGGVTPRVAPFIDIQSAGSLLQRAGFALPVTDVEHHTVRYADPLALMRELKVFGASNPMIERSQQLLGKARLIAAATTYQTAHADPDGRIRASLEILWMSGWNPHESQQKPLKPGSAKARLADFLTAEERKLPSSR